MELIASQNQLPTAESMIAVHQLYQALVGFPYGW